MATNTLLEKKVAHLEFINDQLDAELRSLNELLIKTGFPNGLQTVKEVAQDMLENGFEDCE